MNHSSDEIRVGLSTCLLGEHVRYDGGHKRDRYVVGTLTDYFQFVPVCPEVEVGMGIPREAVRLVRDGRRTRMLGNESGTDHTLTMERWAKRRTAELRELELSGYILKKGSPSCGMERVPVYTTKGHRAASGRGLYAEALMRALPLLPVEEEGRLQDPVLRESFIERVFAYWRVRRLFARGWKTRDLVAFQQSEKLLLMAHSPKGQSELGRLVADAGSLGRKAVAERYQTLYMRVLSKTAPRRRHVNVLQHMMGHLKDDLDSEDKHELLGVIEDFAAGLVPLVVPITLLRHHARRNRVEYLLGQRYLDPHPKELMLRNHV